MNPDVITTGYLSLIVDDPSASADEVSQLGAGCWRANRFAL
jgi:hypothetical protein